MELDGDTPSQLYDFVTVVLHEIAHGLGFTGFFYVSNNLGYYDFNEIGDATSYDIMVLNKSNQYLVDQMFLRTLLPSFIVHLLLIHFMLIARLPLYDNNGNNPKLYAPENMG